jgi:outer membrane protein OmpA-like peptidoglycan-associated protein
MESDTAGFKYAMSAGYDPAGLRDFLRAVQERGRTEPAVAQFFSTHPATDDRLREQETLLRSASAGGRRNIARFERAAIRRGPAIATPAAITPPTPIGPKGAITSQFLQSLASSGRYVTHAIVFESNSERFRPESKAAVKEIADALASTPSLRVRIEGHTDSQGNPMANMQLSQRRADAVRNVLVTEFGVDVRRVSTIGLGASRPITTNDTPEGRATNRRVEFVREP